ncbi:MAG: protein-glutamate O-methyltransferase CheR [Nitrospirota bacterium]|nr:protein-glutamate O-methyltransferase CheR [Nitrospirota bacterium]
MTVAAQPELEDLEVHLLLEGIFRHYGYDFRDYAQASLKRRIRKALQAEQIRTVSALQDAILHDEQAMRHFLDLVTVDVTAMFRDPRLYVAVRTSVIPLIRNEPLIRVWHVGCASGEEVYSMAILLHEEGLLEKTRLYATDLNQSLLDRGKEGIYPLSAMQTHTGNYLAGGGTRAFSEYYAARYDRAQIKPWLKANIVWAQHDLVAGASFNEFHVILCRNVMIYFNRSLQDRVHRLLYESLAPGGVLALGDKESLQFTPHEAGYESLDRREKLFRKRK